jgi:hypothetical protein
VRNFSTTIDIDAPAERVWEVMSDIDRWHEWTPSICSIKRLHSAPFAVGTEAVVRQPKFPPALWKITAVEPGRNFTWVSSGPGIRAVARHWIEPVGDKSRAGLSLDFHGLFGGLLGRMTKNITERYLAFEARGLKARSENPAFRHAQARSKRR